MSKTFVILSVLILAITYSVFGQLENNIHDFEGKLFLDQKKVKKQKPEILVLKRNVLKWNITPMLWNSKNINLSYERVTANNRSFSVNAGYFVLPTFFLGSADSFNLKKSSKSIGFSVSGDKRYYFKKRNTGLAPNGLYWGIFGSVHYYEFETSFNIENSTIAKGNLILNGNIGIISAGVELGYQFVLKNNLTIDLIFMGPALSTYSGKLGISGNIQVDKDSEYIQAIYDVMVAKFPGIDRLLEEKSIKDNGTLFTFGPGLRYMIQIGYRF